MRVDYDTSEMMAAHRLLGRILIERCGCPRKRVARMSFAARAAEVAWCTSLFEMAH